MSTVITGLVGYPTAHSLSPRIHDYWIKQYNLQGEYKLFTTKPARLRQTMQHMRKKNWRGVNITIPHKQDVMLHVDQYDSLAQRIGAVNTITNDNGVLTGTNTDAYGFITNLREGLGELAPYLDDVILLGAGGATRATIVALQDAGAKSITLINRTLETAQALADKFNLQVLPWDVRSEALKTATLLVNTTSLGMKDHPPLEIDLKELPTSAAVHDIVYAPVETGLLKAARERGNRIVDGRGMLLYQAQRAFKEWYGILPPVTAELRQLILAPMVEDDAADEAAA